MRFNYLRDSVPDAFERLYPHRIPESFHTPLAALATAVIAVCCWWGIERILLHQATAELHAQTMRLNESRAALGEAHVRRMRLESLVALDERLRAIRRSGAELSGELADVANHVPRRAWLTSIVHLDRSVEIDGQALGLDGLGDTVADLMTSSAAQSPKLLRASRNEGGRTSGIISFAVRIDVHR